MLIVKNLALHNFILQTQWKVGFCHAGEMHECSLAVLAVSSWNVIMECEFLGLYSFAVLCWKIPSVRIRPGLR